VAVVAVAIVVVAVAVEIAEYFDFQLSLKIMIDYLNDCYSLK